MNPCLKCASRTRGRSDSGLQLSMSAETLKRCAMLVPAGTGTSTLQLLLSDALSAVYGAGSPIVNKFAQHNHHLGPLPLYNAGARCFLVPLRDPAMRVETGFRFESVMSSRLIPHIFMYRPQFGMHNLSEFIRLLRHPYEETSIRALRLYHSSLRGYLNLQRNATARAWDRKFPEPDAFLVPVTKYLQAMPEGAAIHFICTERMDEDWMCFRDRFRNELAAAGAMHLLGDAFKPKWKNRRNDTKGRSQYGEADRDFVRHELFPADTQLWRRACRRPTFDGDAPRTVCAEPVHRRDLIAWNIFQDAGNQSQTRFEGLELELGEHHDSA